MNEPKIGQITANVIIDRFDRMFNEGMHESWFKDFVNSLVGKNWIDIEDDIKPEHEENVLGFAGYWWVFQYHAEHNHYLEYSERRKRWEFTTNSHNVTKWQPLPS